MRIAVVAPSCPLKPDAAERVEAIVAERGDCEVVIHPQCFLVEGHFAGPDAARLAVLREVMADPSVDAVWFSRGGYGSNRIAEAALSDLPAVAREKTYLGYSDAGFLLAGFHKAGLEVVWGPMPQDALRSGGAEVDGGAAVVDAERRRRRRRMLHLRHGGRRAARQSEGRNRGRGHKRAAGKGGQTGRHGVS